MRPVVRILTAVLAVAALAPAASAQAPDDAAQAFSDAVKAWLDEAVIAPMADAGFDIDAAIDVDMGDSGYRVTIADLAVTMPAGSLLAVGTIEAVVTPRDDGRYAVTAHLPSDLFLYTADGTERLTAAIGGQAFAGVFAPALQTFTTLDVRLDDIRVAVPSTGLRVTIGHTGLDSETFPAAAGTHDMASALVVENIDVVPGNTEERITVERLAVTSTLAALDLDAYAAFVAAYRGVIAEGRAGSGSPDPGAINAKLAQLIEDTPPLVDGIAVTYGVAGLRAAGPDGAIMMGRIRAALSAEALAGDAATLHATGEMTGIAIEPSADADLLPRQAELDVTVSGVPNAALTALLAERLRGGTGSGVRPGPAAPPPAVWERLLEALGEAGTTMRLDRLSLDSGTAAIEMSGSAHPVPEAAQGVVATLSIRIRGMSHAMQELRRLPEAAPLTLVLAVLQLAGVAETDAAGRSTIRYDLEMTADGRTVVNGVDLAPLLGMVPEGTPPP